jgi:hypothetical protein
VAVGLSGLAVGRVGTAAPVLAGAVVLVCAAGVVLVRRDTFDG